MKNNIEILIPTFNEEGNIESTILELNEKGFFNIKILDGQSTDKTVEISKKLGCKILVGDKNSSGFGSSIINGINESNFEYCCIFDGDGSFNPESIIDMIEEIKKDDHDFVFCSRYKDGMESDDDTFIRKIGNFFFTQLISLLFNFKSTDALFLYVLGKTKKFQDLKLTTKDFALCPEILIKAFLFQKSKEIYSHERKRLFGFSKVNAFKDGFLILNKIVYHFIEFKILRKKL
jgi:glycosyltransferase involved in cell wall biosynthesis